MTLLYRLDTADSPDFGSETFWTMRENEAAELARWEGRAATATYRVEVVFDDTELVEMDVERLGRLRGGSFNRDDLLALVQDRAPADCAWVQFTTGLDPAGSWKGAMLYWGDEPLPAERVRVE